MSEDPKPIAIPSVAEYEATFGSMQWARDASAAIVESAKGDHRGLRTSLDIAMERADTIHAAWIAEHPCLVDALGEPEPVTLTEDEITAVASYGRCGECGHLEVLHFSSEYGYSKECAVDGCPCD
jgi:hypothetical protein